MPRKSQLGDLRRSLLGLRQMVVPSVVAGLLLCGCEFFGGKDVNDTEVEATFTIDLPLAAPTQEQIDATPVEDGMREVVLPVNYEAISLAQLAPELAQYQGEIKSVRVDLVYHTITTNSLSVSVQPVEVRIGSTEGDFETASPVVETMALPPRAVGEQQARVSEFGRANASLYMSNLSFGLGAQISYAIPADATPSGSAESTLRFEVTALVNR